MTLCPDYRHDASRSAPQDSRPKIAKGCRRSRSNPQLRPSKMAMDQDDTQPVCLSPLGNPLSASGNIYPSSKMSERETTFSDYYFPPLGSACAFRTNNLCAKASPLVQRSDSRNCLKSYLVPLSDFSGTSGMIKSKSLDKLDEIMRNDPILGDDYCARSPPSKSTQTQTDESYPKKKPRRPRNDRPRSQILPPTYLQLPSVTCELSPDENSKGQAQPSKRVEVQSVWGENYTPRRKSKQEQAQIVQRWITEMIEHNTAQKLQKQTVNREVVREKSTKLKKKSRSVPEHAFRGKLARLDNEGRRRATMMTSSDDDDDPSVELKRQRNNSDEKTRDVVPRLRHADSDPSFMSAMSRRNRDDNPVSIGNSTSQSADTSPTETGITPSLQSRIRSLEQSFNNQSPNLQVNTRPTGRSANSPSQLTDDQGQRLRVSNPDLPLISRLLSDKELDSEC